MLNDQGIDYLEVRCIDLNPNSFVGISREQVYFLDLLILYCFFTESPEILEDESKELFKNHKTIVNDGRDPDAKIKTLNGDVLVKEEAMRILDGMSKVATFMDEEVFKEGSIWSETVGSQKKIMKIMIYLLVDLCWKKLIKVALPFRNTAWVFLLLIKNK